MRPQQTTGDRDKARRHRAETSVQRASQMSANQLWKCARLLREIATLVGSAKQRADLEARADRADGVAWDKALRHQIDHANLP